MTAAASTRLLALLLLVSSCGQPSHVSNVLEVSDLPLGPSQSIRVHTALTSADSAAWDATESALTSYVAFWQNAGIDLSLSKLSLAVEPSPEIPHAEALEHLYGADALKKISELKTQVNAVTSRESLSALSASAFCAMPPLLVKSVELDETDDLEKAKAKALAQLDGFLGNSAAGFTGFPSNNAFAGYIPTNRCGAIVLGRSDVSTGRQHSFATTDVTFHEMGHIFHGAIWEPGEPIASFRQSHTVNETAADIFAHIYLGTSCHNVRSLTDPNTGKLCSRDMNSHDLPLSVDIWSNSFNGHNNGQALRHLAWNLATEVGREMFATAFVESMKEVRSVLVANDVFDAKTTVPKDPVLSEINIIKRNLLPAKFLAENLCSRLAMAGSCSTLAEFLGPDVSGSMKALSDRAPSRQLGKWQEGKTTDDEPFRYRFILSQDGRNIECELSRSGGPIHHYVSNGSQTSGTGLGAVQSLSFRRAVGGVTQFMEWEVLSGKVRLSEHVSFP